MSDERQSRLEDDTPARRRRTGRGQAPPTRTGSSWRRLTVLALAAMLVPLWSTGAGAQQSPPTRPPVTSPPAENCQTIGFTTATVESLSSTRYRLTVSGTVAWRDLRVRLQPHTYIQQPEYWGIEVQGCRYGDVGLPATAPYTVTYEFDGPLGTRGIEVIGAGEQRQRFDLANRPAPSPLAGTSWVLTGGSPVPRGRSITATFSETHITGTAACNQYSAPYRVLDGRRIEITGPIVTTRIGCEPAVAAAEAAYLRRLAGVTSYRIHRGQLRLTGPQGTLRYRSAPVVAPVGPVGSWQVTGYFAGTPGAIVPLVTNSTISLVIRPDGTLGGEACNFYSGPYKSDGSAFSVGDITATLRLCEAPGVSDQESRYFAALRSATSWRRDGDRLVLLDAQGREVVTAVAVPAT